MNRDKKTDVDIFFLHIFRVFFIKVFKKERKVLSSCPNLDKNSVRLLKPALFYENYTNFVWMQNC